MSKLKRSEVVDLEGGCRRGSRGFHQRASPVRRCCSLGSSRRDPMAFEDLGVPPAGRGSRRGAEVDAVCAYRRVGGTGWAQPGTADNRISAV